VVTAKEPVECDAVVIGAGFAGLYALYSLRERLGFDVQVFERGNDVGGTWYWNRYPGARCDSDSTYYNFSFDPDLEQDWPLLDRYPEQPTILHYLRHVAKRFDLRRNIQFETSVSRVVWDDELSKWHVETDQGDRVTARFVITAVGCLSSANMPKIAGQENFKGEVYHTGHWPHEQVDFTGARVGVIGTGSTGIQAIPVIAKLAKHLTVFQRTAQYTVPANNHQLDQEVVKEVKSNYRTIRQEIRESPSGTRNKAAEFNALEVDEQTRIAAYQKSWEAGGAGFLGTFKDIMLDEAANDTAAEFVKNKISEIVKDPETARKLTPTKYRIGTKRPPIDSGYYETYNRENVSLVDLDETPIVEITDNGVRTSDDEHELDILVYATGFDAFTGSLIGLNIEGRDGLKLADKWAANGPTTYLGVAVAGFPNLFMITGPGSPSVLTNVPTAIEQHVEWIERLIKQLVDEGAPTVEALQEAEDAWTEHGMRVANRTMMVKTASWYMGANVEGKVLTFLPYVGGVGRYRQICEEAAANDHRGFRIPGHPLPTEIVFGSIRKEVAEASTAGTQ
jgi:cation diffusion facilitator CzcD-associated flavoprotein CzcO